jgi:hypothetical protein
MTTVGLSEGKSAGTDLASLPEIWNIDQVFCPPDKPMRRYQVTERGAWAGVGDSGLLRLSGGGSTMRGVA